jgi:hypothetical protein
MAQGATITVGSRVRITRVRDRIPSELVSTLKADPMATVTGFRTVDGKGIGVVVKLAQGQTVWFFDDEVTPA